MEQGTLTAISAATGVITALGAFVAAIAAFRSARTAESATKHAREAERRSLVLRAKATANSIIAETLRVDDIGHELTQAYKTLATFAGQIGGSREKLFVEQVKRKQNEVVPLQQEAREFLENEGSTTALDDEELSSLLSKFEGYLVQIQRVKEKFVHELGSVERENQIYRENKIED